MRWAKARSAAWRVGCEACYTQDLAPCHAFVTLAIMKFHCPNCDQPKCVCSNVGEGVEPGTIYTQAKREFELAKQDTEWWPTSLVVTGIIAMMMLSFVLSWLAYAKGPPDAAIEVKGLGQDNTVFIRIEHSLDERSLRAIEALGRLPGEPKHIIDRSESPRP